MKISENKRPSRIPSDSLGLRPTFFHLSTESFDSIGLDRHHSDQLLIYSALANGISKFPISYENGKMPSHVETAIYVIEQFCGKIFELKENILHVDGIKFSVV